MEMLCGEKLYVKRTFPDIQVRKRDPHFADQQRFKDGHHGRRRPAGKPDTFTAEDFSFDPTNQVYRCPQGHELTCHARNQVNRYRTYAVYHARTESCSQSFFYARPPASNASC
jgi:hypothetical protein